MHSAVKKSVLAIVVWLALLTPSFAQTTIFSETLNSSDSGNSGITIRSVLTITGGALGQVRATFTSPGGSATTFDHASIGISNGTDGDTTAIPVELTFSGGHGFTLSGAGGSVTSDFVNLSGFTSSDHLVVTLDFNASTGGGVYGINTTTAGATGYALVGASYNVVAPAGQSNLGTYSIVATVQVQAGGGGGVTCGKAPLLHAGC